MQTPLPPTPTPHLPQVGGRLGGRRSRAAEPFGAVGIRSARSGGGGGGGARQSRGVGIREWDDEDFEVSRRPATKRARTAGGGAAAAVAGGGGGKARSRRARDFSETPPPAYDENEFDDYDEEEVGRKRKAAAAAKGEALRHGCM
jgi:hypothetical protein